jgi:hypothetical protein
MAEVKMKFGDRDIVLDTEKNKKLIAQLENVEKETREAAFKGKRDTFMKAAKGVIDSQTEGFDDEIDGMSLVYDMAEDTITLVDSRLITIKQRLSKVATPWHEGIEEEEEVEEEAA